MKEKATRILAGIVILSFLIIVFYALITSRIFELIIICIVFFGVVKLLIYAVISRFNKDKQKSIKDFFEKNIAITSIIAFFVIFGTFFFGYKVVDGFTPVDILTERIHNRSKYKFSGSKCNDGWNSYSQGQGACSWHDGVRYEFFKNSYSKTLEECKVEAEEISWLDL